LADAKALLQTLCPSANITMAIKAIVDAAAEVAATQAYYQVGYSFSVMVLGWS
jgi:hypothetical protein